MSGELFVETSQDALPCHTTPSGNLKTRSPASKKHVTDIPILELWLITALWMIKYDLISAQWSIILVIKYYIPNVIVQVTMVVNKLEE